MAFPDNIAADLNITCANPKWDGNGCTICHHDNGGGIGTAVRPFGIWMKGHGLSKGDTTELAQLLTQAKTDNVDSNCDGTPDIDQLTNCQWEALSVNQCAPDAGQKEPQVNVIYGCATSGAVSATHEEDPMTFAFLAFSLMWARRVMQRRQ